jgi:hypothetical protein
MAIQNMLSGLTSPLSRELGGTNGLPGTYVSKDIGSDLTGDGTMAKPFASFAAAIASLGAPLTPKTIIGLDAAIYNENLLFSVGNINIYAPQAELVPTVGYAIILNVNVAMKVSFKSIVRDVVSNVFGTLFINCEQMYGNVTGNNGIIILNASLYGAGGINGGAGGGSVSGFISRVLPGYGPYVGDLTIMTGSGPLLPVMRIGDIAVAGNYKLPVSDGTAGQQITTNGAGVAVFS